MEKRKPINKMIFEEALSELEEIAERLESGELGLDDSIIEFERGTKLVKSCQGKLEEAERKIEILQMADEDDNMDESSKKKVKKKKVKVKEDTGEIEDSEDIQGSLL